MRCETGGTEELRFLCLLFSFRSVHERREQGVHTVVVTNNPLVASQLSATHAVDLVDGGYADVLCVVRDRIHQGAVLLSHPLYGSVKPDRTPYRSVLMRMRVGQVDANSLKLIEAALGACASFACEQRDIDPAVLRDFQTVDLALLRSALGAQAPCAWKDSEVSA